MFLISRIAPRTLPVLLFLVTFSKPHAQTLGGNAAYNFLALPSNTFQSAAGGVAVSHPISDVALALNNPALLRAAMHAHVGLHFTRLPAGIFASQLSGAYYDAKRNTTFGSQVFYVNYGTFQATDAAGNNVGQFRAADYAVQVAAARRYLQKCHYGASIKFIHSSYQQYRSSAFAIDVGLHYLDTATGISIGVLAKNMGVQLKTYAGEREDLPFDLQIGITKRLAKAPLAFSATVQQAHRFDIVYNDTLYNNETGRMEPPSFGKKLFRHFIFSSQIFISPHLDATIGYNQLRRSELGMGTVGNGLSGFSAGIAVRFEKLHVSLARSSYQRGIAYNQLGLNLMLNKLSGAGRF